MVVAFSLALAGCGGGGGNDSQESNNSVARSFIDVPALAFVERDAADSRASIQAQIQNTPDNSTLAAGTLFSPSWVGYDLNLMLNIL
jgi:hypothetical protein